MEKNYESYSKEELIEQIKHLKENIKKKFGHDENLPRLNLEWAGSLGEWYWDVQENHVIFNDKKVEAIGYDPNDLEDIGFEFFTEKLHPDDYDRVMDNMRDHLDGQSEAYEIEYRIKHKDGHYKWYYDRGMVTKRDKDGKPLYVQGIVFDISERKKVEERLRELSEKDPLTKAYNRRYMFKKIDQLIGQYEDNQTPFSLIMFDLDRFKEINDEHGHLVGDDILKEMTQMIFNHLRDKDVLCRYGGDEFFMVLPDTELKEAKKAAKRIKDQMANMSFEEVDEVTVSMGVATYHKNEAIDDIVKRVDDLVYQAKDDGRNTIKFEE